MFHQIRGQIGQNRRHPAAAMGTRNTARGVYRQADTSDGSAQISLGLGRSRRIKCGALVLQGVNNPDQRRIIDAPYPACVLHLLTIHV